jgi:hypothetical protein
MSVNKPTLFWKLAIISLLLCAASFFSSPVKAQNVAKGRGERATSPGPQNLQQPKSTDQATLKAPEPTVDSSSQNRTTPDEPQRNLTGPSVKKEISFGDFKLTAIVPPGWLLNGAGDGFKRAEAALAGDGAQLTPVFAFASASGAVVFGTLQVLSEGSYYPASVLRVRRDELPSEWKAPPDGLTSGISRLKGPLLSEFSFSNLVSNGNGLLYDAKAVGNTIGTWISIPVIYKNAQGYQSVIVSFTSRATDSVQADANAILESMMDTLSLETGLVVQVDEYRAAYKAAQAKLKNQTLGGDTTSTTPTPSGKAQPSVGTPSAILSSFATTNAFVLQSLFEKGSPVVLSIRVDPKTGETQLVNAVPVAPNQ